MANFGMTNNDSNIYQRVEIIQQSVGLSPSFIFKSDAIKHQISFNWRMGLYEQFDVNTLDYADRANTNYACNYRM